MIAQFRHLLTSDMLPHKHTSCLKCFGISITSCIFLLTLSPPSLEAKAITTCKLINEGEPKPGMACECEENPLRGHCYLTKRHSSNMTCIDCPPGYYYEFKVFDCRPCPQPSYNCFKHNHAERDCRPCPATEPPSPPSQASTTDTTITSPPSDKPVSSQTQGTQTVRPSTQDTKPQGLVKTTSSTPSSASPTTQKTGNVATKKTTEDKKDMNSSGFSNNIGTVVVAIVFFFVLFVAIFKYVILPHFSKHSGTSSSGRQSRGVVVDPNPLLQETEM